jgi:hypothetical protein
MERLSGIADDCEVAEFDQIVVKGQEIKRLLPGAFVPLSPAHYTDQSQLQLAGQWLCDGSINGWCDYLISKYDNFFKSMKTI